MTNENDSLAVRLMQWLDGQGYPLEMTTAIALQKNNFSVTLSDYYTDFETKETREIDVTALRWSDFNQPVALQVCCRIECKLARDKPWLVFVPQAERNIWLPPFTTISSSVFSAFWTEGLKKEKFTEILKGASLLRPNHVGYGITQAFTTGQDVPYRAVMSSVKAAIDRARQMNDMFDETKINPKASLLCCVVIPAIIIDGKLFESSVNSDGSLHLDEVGSSIIEWKGSNPTHTSPLVHIITKSMFSQFVQELDATANVLITLASEYMQDLADIATKLRSRNIIR